ncbi:MAG: hypothetical protein ACKESB_02955 [Candidatus Hodgkinia cicadicola]
METTAIPREASAAAEAEKREGTGRRRRGEERKKGKGGKERWRGVGFPPSLPPLLGLLLQKRCGPSRPSLTAAAL